ncbi:MAG: PTS glucose transporter subunit IIA [Selenomonadaceae bacterium]|nr:PTS glucose transporter subunit IIA [Selenomonadaceae bacterium]
MRNIILTAPVEGRLVSLREVNDADFSSGRRGRGAAVKNCQSGKIISPFNGHVLKVFGNAISIVSNNGIKLFIQADCALNTFVVENLEIENHQVIATFDNCCDVMFAVTNQSEFGNIEFEEIGGSSIKADTPDKNSKGGKSLDTKLTILGETGSGKTCYLLGMYYEMSAGRDGYSIIATDRDESRLLVTRFKNLKDASLGRARFPEPTDAAQKYKFELQHAFNTILPFEWIDYPGGWLDASKSAGSELDEVENSIYNSSALFICIDGENLIADNTQDKIDRVREKCSRHISPYLGRLANNNRGKKFPPVALIITKFDLCNRETDEDEIRLILEKCFSPLFERDDTFIVIIPVSLGSELQDDEYRGTFKPINLHLPIYMGIWFALRDYMRDYEKQIQNERENIYKRSNEENTFSEPVRKLGKALFPFAFDVFDAVQAIRKPSTSDLKQISEDKIKRLQDELNAMKKSYERLERELYSINLTYINGRWRK